jgi:FAD/FMN-containing dehydrogenase
MAELTRRAALMGGGAVIGGAFGYALAPNGPSRVSTTSLAPTGGAGFLNDASGLSETPVHVHRLMPYEPGRGLTEGIRREMRAAREEGRPFSIGAARHSMGGHAIPPGGHAVTLENAAIDPDTANSVYRVHAGARWSDIIAALDPLGFGPKVMQSNNDFGVAATFSVNAHGWPVAFGPMGSTVQAVEMVLPNEELVRATRDEDPELFALAMGGYGLIGAITSLEVEMVPNTILEPTFERMSSRDFAPRFVAACRELGVSMAYGRLNVDRQDFFENAMMISYRNARDQSEIPPAEGSNLLSHVAASVFRAQTLNESMKDMRWWFESRLSPLVAGGSVTRNSLLNEPVKTLDDGDPTRTDILHEYFVPPERFAEFVEACQQVIPSSYQELLNITLRFVEADTLSVLSYASGPRIACVMLFSQEMSLRAEADHARMTRALIDRTLDLGGTYYLPYRPHATHDQFTRAYPGAEFFVSAKRLLDPDLLLRNRFWDNYLERLK